MTTNEANLTQPWRKTWPLCKPPTPGDKDDAIRFSKEFPEGLDSIDAGDGWTLGDVARGDHDGGLAAGAAVLGAGMGAAAVRARRDRDGRRKLLKSQLLKYLQDEDLKSRLRLSAHGEQMWRDYKATEVGTPTEAKSEDTKTKMRAATILGSVGFNARSIPAFVLYINNLNSSIEPIGDRLAEHDMAVIMLKAVIATRIPTISPTASDEYTAPPANRKFLQPPPNPNFLRSLSLMADHFNRNWEQQIESGLITARRAGGQSTQAGSSTHVDGNEMIISGFEESGFSYDAAQINLNECVLTEVYFVGAMRDAFVGAVQQQSGKRIVGKICFCCFGEGHIGANCPSKPDPNRTLKNQIVLLTSMAAKRAEKGALPEGDWATSTPARSKVPGWWR